MDQIWVYGINHKVAPLALREKLAFSRERLPAILNVLQSELRAAFGCDLDGEPLELVLLSTCNRTELYARSPGSEAARRLVCAYFARLAGMESAALAQLAYTRCGLQAVEHLFRVSAGLDSLLLGENEILGQVKNAWQSAQEAGACGATLDAMFRLALRTGKRIRTETELGRSGRSFASMVVDLATETFGSLNDRTALIIGAGKISAMTARALVGAGLQCVLVANRTFDRAQRLAQLLGSQRAAAVHFDALPERLHEADIVICSTGAPHQVLHKPMVEAVLQGRTGRAMLIADLAVPRDADPDIARLPGVRLVDMDALDRLVQSGDPLNSVTRQAAAELVADGVVEFTEWRRARQAVPIIRALHAKADAICAAQVAHTLRRMGELTPEQQEAIETMAHAIVNQLLHSPIKYVRTHPDDLLSETTEALVQRIFALNGYGASR
jgi:glutamyl-tRNA reductase